MFLNTYDRPDIQSLEIFLLAPYLKVLKVHVKLIDIFGQNFT